jgi:LAGLIDADG endonuclease
VLCPWRQFAAPRVGNGAESIWLYAGKPGVSRATGDVRRDVFSDNVTGAENQQERLSEFRGWVIGFVDGEGCFSIGFVRQSDRAGRKGYRAGYQVFHRFVVTQGVKSLACLEELRDFFGVGRIFVNQRHDNHKEHLCQYLVGRRSELMETIIPFFRQFPLRSARSKRTSRSSLVASSSPRPVCI